jgi:transcriptional regulator with XRE-family HTH domain
VEFAGKQMAQIRNQILLNKIALRLKELREEKGVSQEHLYNETEIHIARVETAKVNVSVSTLERLCSYFGLTLGEFFAGIERKEK